ncbi:hypothetical protein FSB65_38430 [Paraburkholderia sp. JPY418]|nr:hypothetical protein [Paraburkholderia youngii]
MASYRAWKRAGSGGRTRLTDTQLLTLIRTVHTEAKGAPAGRYKRASQQVLREVCCRSFVSDARLTY